MSAPNAALERLVGQSTVISMASSQDSRLPDSESILLPLLVELDAKRKTVHPGCFSIFHLECTHHVRYTHCEEIENVILAWLERM